SSASESDLLTITVDAEADENPPERSDDESALTDAPLRRRSGDRKRTLTASKFTASTFTTSTLIASRPLQAVASVAAAWLFAYTAHAAKLDLVTLVAIILGTTALNRYGSTVLDRVMAALVMLAGSAIVGGLVISFWPWGLDPVAVGGFALSTLITLSFATRRPFRLPRHFAAADGIAILSGAAATTIAAWPTTHGDFWKRFDYSALLAD